MKLRHGQPSGTSVSPDAVNQKVPGEQITAPSSNGGAAAAAAPVPQPTFAFDWMFGGPSALPPADNSKLVELGLAMESEDPDDGADPLAAINNQLPAGYTFLGQFITHDITLAQTDSQPPTIASLASIKSARSPYLDLDSLYGTGPGGDADLYLDGVRFKIGSTNPTLGAGAPSVYPNDLPRNAPDSNAAGQAIVADSRNDDNLGTAQLTVAFLQFHNNVADKLKSKYSGSALFDHTKRVVTQHYQWIVLHDFLPKIADQGVLADVLNGNSYFKLPQGQTPYVPAEFAFAAFRLGHVMLRTKYEWNKLVASDAPQGAADLFDLFSFTGFGGMSDAITKLLPSNWVIDWTRFFDFSGRAVANNPRFNYAKKFDTTLSKALTRLFTLFLPSLPEEYRSLAVLDLVRGASIGIPSAQEVAARYGTKFSVKLLDQTDIVADPYTQLLTAGGFDKATPLWFYILREAEKVNGGTKLGPMGSRIVVETLVELIKASDPSVMSSEDWELDLRDKTSNRFEMADLLLFAGNPNPLGA